MAKGWSVVIAALLALCSLVAQAAGKIDINTAEAAVIAAALPGVGESKAAAIVRYREMHGPFTKVEQLVKVKGIGDKTLSIIRDKISITTAN